MNYFNKGDILMVGSLLEDNSVHVRGKVSQRTYTHHNLAKGYTVMPLESLLASLDVLYRYLGEEDFKTQVNHWHTSVIDFVDVRQYLDNEWITVDE